MTILNLTPHKINIFDEEKSPIISLESNGVARCTTTKVKEAEVNGIPVFRTEYGAIIGLPEQRDGVTIIVSLLVRQAAPERDDLVSPGELLRDEKGQPVGCIGLTR